MATDKPGDELLRVRLSIGTVVTAAAIILPIVVFVWTSAERLSRIEAQQDRHARELAMAMQLGREQRETIARASLERHQQQQTEIDRLRVEQATTTAFIAETRARLETMAASIGRIEQWLRPSPDQPRR